MNLRKLIIPIFVYLLSSCDKNSANNTLKTNSWIQEVMEEVYLWEEHIPDNLSSKDYSDSFDFFDNLLYVEDYWSWLSNDFFATKNMLDGITTTGGYEFLLTYTDEQYYNIKGIIEYTLPRTPADLNDIKRGDIFTRINNTSLNIDNYYSLLTSYTSYTIGFDTIINGELTPLKDINITEVENFQENPIHIDSVYSIDGKKIAYLMYNQFIAEFNANLDETFAFFKSENITDLIVDLRYNPGGDVSAEIHMANLIAPNSAISEIFKKNHWNQLYTDYISSEFGEEFFYTRIEEASQNINMTGKIIAITSNSTASASEGLINGLEPLTDMTLVGDTTHGKYTGMWVIPDNDSIWAIIPIVVKTTNKEDVSVKGGMVPDILLSDNPLDGYQLGDIRETMLARAIEEITGTPVTRSARIQPDFMGEEIGRFKHGKELKAQARIVGWGQDLLIRNQE